MKYKVVIFSIIVNLSNILYSQSDITSVSKFSINVETGIAPVSSQNSTSLLCYQGLLGVEYNIVSNIQMGVFGQILLYHQNTDLANLENKIIELSSIEYSTVGLTVGYKARLNQFILYPKIDVGYNIFTAKSLDFETDKNQFLDYRYLSLTPKVQLGYAISKQVATGIFLGYNTQLTALKGQILNEFNPNSVQGGVYMSLNLE